MPLHHYQLFEPAMVIEDDARDWQVSWANHLARSGRGGVDLVAPSGTPVRAPTPGRLVHRPGDGSAGNSCRFEHELNPGWQDVFSHLSGYVGASGRRFEQGEVIAYTGGSGGVEPHLHRHLLDPAGNRRNPIEYFSDRAVELPAPEEGVLLQQLARLGGYMGPIDGVPGPNTWRGVQAVLARRGWYAGPIDGIPGPNTWKGVQQFARGGGYLGPIDGVPGANTLRGLRLALA